MASLRTKSIAIEPPPTLRITRAPTTPYAFARVISQSLESGQHGDGLWRGIVEGNGQIHLKLLIRRDGLLETSSYMGNIHLNNKRTTFQIRTPMPTGNNWRWEVVAYAE